MPDSNADFTYVSVLRELEKEVAKASDKDVPEAGAGLTRSNNWFKGTVGGLLSFATGRIANGNKSIAKKLNVTVQAIKKAEDARLRHLGSWSQKHTRYEGGKAATWPPLIPIGLTVEKFIGTTIGLHSESPDEPFANHLRTSLGEAVAPALAWGLWCQLQEVPQEIRPLVADEIGRSVTDQKKRDGDRAKLVLQTAQKGSAEIPYLRLFHGWVQVLGLSNARWALKPEEVAHFREKVRAGFEGCCQSPATHLSDLLHHYGTTDHGSERARVVEMAHRRSAISSAFWRNRLSLLSGAHLPELEYFRHLLRTDAKGALNEARSLLHSEISGDHGHGDRACGMAFWLARMTYGKHDSNGMLEAEASTLTLKLLQSAARVFSNEPDKRTYCLRFAAGYASNPRYFRSDFVMANMSEAARAYGRETKHRPALLSMFHARIAWQVQSCEKGRKKRDASKAARLYNEALEGATGSAKGLDAEAPVHLFPELYVFLDEFSAGSGGGEKVLSVIDHVVQHNYGVYFDATIEAKLIKAGVAQFCDWHERTNGGTSPSDAVRSLARAKEDGDIVAQEMLERQVRAANAARPRSADDEEARDDS